MNMILAATSPEGQLFWLIAPENPAQDGFLMADGGKKFVPFWSYVSRTPEIVPVKGTALLNELWSKDDSEAWTQKFVTRDVPLADEDLMSVEFLLVEVPDEVEPAQEFGSL